MANYLFTTGTVTKAGFYAQLKSILIGAGWTNISSNATTDFDVFQSLGEDGTRNLIVQMRSSSTTATNPIDTTDYNSMSIRLPGAYTPGTSGAAGTFPRGVNDVWQALYVLGTATTSPKDTTTLTYRYHVNKNRLIMIIDGPSALGLGSVVFYLGLPDEIYCTDSASKGVIFGISNNASTAGSVWVTDAPADTGAATASAARTVYGTLTPKNPNIAGKYSLTEMTYGNTTEGERGKMLGIWCMPNTYILNGDTLTYGTNQYYVSVCQVTGNNSFLSNAIVVQTA